MEKFKYLLIYPMLINMKANKHVMIRSDTHQEIRIYMAQKKIKSFGEAIHKIFQEVKYNAK